MKKIYQIQIALKGSKPKIWRRVLVPSDLLLPDLHAIIQTSMGWTNSHMHQFFKDGKFYAPRMPDDDMWGEMQQVDYTNIRISAVLKREKAKVIYEYDFGDGWVHDVILEKTLPADEAIKYPVCVAGKLNCPPEDCGGIWGYYHMLDVLKDPGHKEYEETVEWLDRDFDPTEFDKEMVTNLLRTEGYGCYGF